MTYCVRPSIAHSSGPTGIVIRGSSQGLSCSRPHGPCRPRGAGRPCRGARAPIRRAALGRARSASAPRGCEVPRARAARSGLVGGRRGRPSPAWRITATISSTVGGSGRVAQPLVCAAAARRDSPVGWPASDAAGGFSSGDTDKESPLWTGGSRSNYTNPLPERPPTARAAGFRLSTKGGATREADRPRADDSLSSRLSRRRSWRSRGRDRRGRVVGDGPAVSGGATADRAVLGRHGGYLVAVDLGEVVGHHQ